MIKNRQIKTGFDSKREDYSLEVLSSSKDIKLGSKVYKAGDSFSCTKSEARRLMSLMPGAFKVVLD